MAVRRIPLFGSYVNRNVVPSVTDGKDQYLINCYPEVYDNQISGRKTVFLNKRPGTVASSDTATGNLATRGSCIWWSNSVSQGATGVAPVVFSFTKSDQTEVRIYQYDGSTIAQVGTAIASTDSCDSLSDTMISGTGNLVALVGDSGSNAIEAYFFPEGGAWTQITDVDFPANQTPARLIVGAPVHMDGYMFVMCSDGTIWNSDINSLSAWTSTSFITAQAATDGGAGLARYGQYIVAFGQGSIEFFENAGGGSSGSPLRRISGDPLNIGALRSTARQAVLEVGETVYFIGAVTGSGLYGVYRLNGFQAEKVSNTAIDKVINGNVFTSTIVGIAGAFTAHGMQHIALLSLSPDYVVHCFCIETATWWQFKVLSGVQPITSALGHFGVGYITLGTAKIFSMQTAVWRDGSDAYTMTFQDDGDASDEDTTNRKFVTKLRIVGDTQSSTSNLGVAYSDDDGASFSTARNIDLSSATKELTRLGSHKNKRQYRFTHSANTPCRLQAYELTQKVGSS